MPLSENSELKGRNIWYAIILGAFCFLLYANTIGNDYAIDDGAVISGNAYVQNGLEGLKGIFTTDIWHFEDADLSYYRPLPLASFAIEHQFFGNNPHISHGINALLFGITCALLFAILLQLFSKANVWLCFIACMLFAAHPIHTEAVANIKSRDELLAFLFMMLSAFSMFRGWSTNKLRWGWVISACFFFYLSLLSKETATAGIIAIPFLLYYSGKFSSKQITILANLLAIVFAGFQLQKYLVLGNIIGPGVNDIVSFPYPTGQRLATAFAHFAYYLKLIFIPWPLSYNYAYNQIPAANWGSLTAIAGAVLFAVLTAIALFGLKRKTIPAAGVTLFLILMLPALGFVLLKGGILAERFLYGPSLGFLIAITYLAFKVLKIPAGSTLNNLSFPQLLPLGLVIFLYSFATISRNSDWKNDETISAHDVKVTPNSCQVHLHYGKKLVDEAAIETDANKRRTYFEKGVFELHQAIDINPKYSRAYFKLAYAYQVAEPNTDSAVYYYNRAIDEAPGYAIAYQNLGILYAELGKGQMALHYLKKAVEINPELSNAQNALKKLQSASAAMGQAAMPESRDSFEIYSSLGIQYAREKDLVNGEKYLLMAANLRPKSVDALVNLAACYGMQHEYTKSEEKLTKALQIDSNNTSVLQNLATLYHLEGKKAREAEVRAKLKKEK